MILNRGDIQGFAQLINDIKYYGYDASKIINEYAIKLSLRLEIKANESKNQTLQN